MGNTLCCGSKKWFQYAICNTLSKQEPDEIYERAVILESRNIARSSRFGEGKIDFSKPHKPLLFVNTELDHIIPVGLNIKNINTYKDKSSVVGLKEFKGRSTQYLFSKRLARSGQFYTAMDIKKMKIKEMDKSKITKRAFIIISLFTTAFRSVYAQLPLADTIRTKQGNIIIQPIFHGAMVIKLDNKTVYIDPYNGINAYKGIEAPDLILITHIHQDHTDTLTLNALNTTKTKLIVPKDVADRLPLKFQKKIILLSNDEKTDILEATIKAVPMYDLPQHENSRHLKGRGNGYVIKYGGKQIYISGDTDDITEMRNLKNIDIAFVCMNQPFTMTIEQAAGAVLDFKPKIIYPYHYRNMNGFSDTEAFKKLVNQTNTNIEVRLRNWYANK